MQIRQALLYPNSGEFHPGLYCQVRPTMLVLPQCPTRASLLLCTDVEGNASVVPKAVCVVVCTYVHVNIKFCGEKSVLNFNHKSTTGPGGGDCAPGRRCLQRHQVRRCRMVTKAAIITSISTPGFASHIGCLQSNVKWIYIDIYRIDIFMDICVQNHEDGGHQRRDLGRVRRRLGQHCAGDKQPVTSQLGGAFPPGGVALLCRRPQD